MPILFACLVGLLPGVQDPPGKSTPELLRDLNHKDATRREAAYEALKAKESTALPRTLKTIANRWFRTAGREYQRTISTIRKEALKTLNPAYLDAKRKELIALLEKGETKAMRPKVEALWKEFYFDFSAASEDPKLAAAVLRLSEIDTRLRALGDEGTDVSGKMTDMFGKLDEAEWMLLLPKRDHATIRHNRKLEGKVPAVEYVWVT